MPKQCYEIIDTSLFVKEGQDHLDSSKKETYTLSRYFPANTVYFYAFPAGEESGFINSVPTWVEELVSGRPLLCSGSNMKVITFASVYNHSILNLLAEMNVVPLQSSHVFILPEDITADVTGKARNDKVKTALRNLKLQKSLVMAQPFLDENLQDSYQISPNTCVWFNDKENLTEYIPSENLPVEYDLFLSGKDFAKSTKIYPTPCVVKMSSSSAGDGVRICNSDEDLKSSKEAFKNLDGHVIIYKFIYSVRNLCVQFGIPADPKKKIEIIGYNEQVIGKWGEFLGGMVTPEFDQPELQDLFKLMEENILPKLRAKGWHGVGGLDVLITEKNKYYFIDPNCRMTASFVFVCQVKNKQIKKSLLGFTGTFEGSESDFRKTVLPIAKLGTAEQLLNIASMSYRNGIFYFYGAVLFDKNTPKEVNAQKVLDLGIKSPTLLCLCEQLGIKSPLLDYKE